MKNFRLKSTLFIMKVLNYLHSFLFSTFISYLSHFNSLKYILIISELLHWQHLRLIQYFICIFIYYWLELTNLFKFLLKSTLYLLYFIFFVNFVVIASLYHIINRLIAFYCFVEVIEWTLIHFIFHYFLWSYTYLWLIWIVILFKCILFLLL